MVKYLVLALMSCILFLACSTSKTLRRAEQPKEICIYEIDDLILESKLEYMEKCYANVLAHKPPESPCEFKMFDAVERRYGLSYDAKNVHRVADELFFPVVFKKVHTLVKTDLSVRERVRTRFKNSKQLERYYLKLYSFHVHH